MTTTVEARPGGEHAARYGLAEQLFYRGKYFNVLEVRFDADKQSVVYDLEAADGERLPNMLEADLERLFEHAKAKKGVAKVENALRTVSEKIFDWLQGASVGARAEALRGYQALMERFTHLVEDLAEPVGSLLHDQLAELLLDINDFSEQLKTVVKYRDVAISQARKKEAVEEFESVERELAAMTEAPTTPQEIVEQRMAIVQQLRARRTVPAIDVFLKEVEGHYSGSDDAEMVRALHGVLGEWMHEAAAPVLLEMEEEKKLLEETLAQVETKVPGGKAYDALVLRVGKLRLRVEKLTDRDQPEDVADLWKELHDIQLGLTVDENQVMLESGAVLPALEAPQPEARRAPKKLVEKILEGNAARAKEVYVQAFKAELAERAENTPPDTTHLEATWRALLRTVKRTAELSEALEQYGVSDWDTFLGRFENTFVHDGVAVSLEVAQTELRYRRSQKISEIKKREEKKGLWQRVKSTFVRAKEDHWDYTPYAKLGTATLKRLSVHAVAITATGAAMTYTGVESTSGMLGVMGVVKTGVHAGLGKLQSFKKEMTAATAQAETAKNTLIQEELLNRYFDGNTFRAAGLAQMRSMVAEVVRSASERGKAPLEIRDGTGTIQLTGRAAVLCHRILAVQEREAAPDAALRARTAKALNALHHNEIPQKEAAEVLPTAVRVWKAISGAISGSSGANAKDLEALLKAAGMTGTIGVMIGQAMDSNSFSRVALGKLAKVLGGAGEGVTGQVADRSVFGRVLLRAGTGFVAGAAKGGESRYVYEQKTALLEAQKHVEASVQTAKALLKQEVYTRDDLNKLGDYLCLFGAWLEKKSPAMALSALKDEYTFYAAHAGDVKRFLYRSKEAQIAISDTFAKFFEIETLEKMGAGIYERYLEEAEGGRKEMTNSAEVERQRSIRRQIASGLGGLGGAFFAAALGYGFDLAKHWWTTTDTPTPKPAAPVKPAYQEPQVAHRAPAGFVSGERAAAPVVAATSELPSFMEAHPVVEALGGHLGTGGEVIIPITGANPVEKILTELVMDGQRGSLGGLSEEVRARILSVSANLWNYKMNPTPALEKLFERLHISKDALNALEIDEKNHTLVVRYGAFQKELVQPLWGHADQIDLTNVIEETKKIDWASRLAAVEGKGGHGTAGSGETLRAEVEHDRARQEAQAGASPRPDGPKVGVGPDVQAAEGVARAVADLKNQDGFRSAIRLHPRVAHLKTIYPNVAHKIEGMADDWLERHSHNTSHSVRAFVNVLTVDTLIGSDNPYSNIFEARGFLDEHADAHTTGGHDSDDDGAYDDADTTPAPAAGRTNGTALPGGARGEAPAMVQRGTDAVVRLDSSTGGKSLQIKLAHATVTTSGGEQHVQAPIKGDDGVAQQTQGVVEMHHGKPTFRIDQAFETRWYAINDKGELYFDSKEPRLPTPPLADPTTGLPKDEAVRLSYRQPRAYHYNEGGKKFYAQAVTVMDRGQLPKSVLPIYDEQGTRVGFAKPEGGVQYGRPAGGWPKYIPVRLRPEDMARSELLEPRAKVNVAPAVALKVEPNVS